MSTSAAVYRSLDTGQPLRRNGATSLQVDMSGLKHPVGGLQPKIETFVARQTMSRGTLENPATLVVAGGQVAGTEAGSHLLSEPDHRSDIVCYYQGFNMATLQVIPVNCIDGLQSFLDHPIASIPQASYHKMSNTHRIYGGTCFGSFSWLVVELSFWSYDRRTLFSGKVNQSPGDLAELHGE